MCKSIKKSCFVVALSFMSIAFYSGNVSSGVEVRQAALTAPSNSDLAAQERLKTEEAVARIKYLLDIEETDQLGRIIQSKKLQGIGVNQPYAGIRVVPGDHVTVRVMDSSGKKTLRTENFTATKPDITVDLPPPPAGGGQ